MKFAFRVDATPDLGSGHLMRCLALAKELRSLGHSVRFLARRMPERLGDVTIAEGHDVVSLPDTGVWSLPIGSGWPVSVQVQDASDSCAVIADADWVICDHYGLGAAWERAVRVAVPRVMAIDDLGRVHDCDLLLDQNYYAEPSTRYLADAAPVALLGPMYALLRPEFAQARASVGPREGRVKRMVLCMGGTDPENATSMTMDAIEKAGLAEIALDVVIGAAHPARTPISSRCGLNSAWRLHVQTDDMARLLAAADLAIGAGGTMTWERCVLGVPTVAVELASNQREVLREGARAGFLYAFDGALDANALATHLKALAANSGLRRHLSETALALTDGRGAARVAAALNADAVAIRRAEVGDCGDIYAWRNAAEIRAASHDSAELSFADHQVWFDAKISDPNCWLLIGERNGSAMGVVRFDRVASDEAKVSIYLVPAAIGTGAGGPLLHAAENWLKAAAPDVIYVTAVVRDGNDTSERLFKRCRYARKTTSFIKRV